MSSDENCTLEQTIEREDYKKKRKINSHLDAFYALGFSSSLLALIPRSSSSRCRNVIRQYDLLVATGGF